MKKILIALITISIVSIQCIAEETCHEKLKYPPALQEEYRNAMEHTDKWNDPETIRFILDKNNDFIFTRDGENILFQGHLDFEFANYSDSIGYITVFAARVEYKGRTYLIPGRFFSGEGDYARLEFYLTNDSLGTFLGKLFKLEDCNTITLLTAGP